MIKGVDEVEISLDVFVGIAFPLPITLGSILDEVFHISSSISATSVVWGVKTLLAFVNS